MVAMVPITNMVISIYPLSEHILKLIIGAMVHHNNIVVDECSQLGLVITVKKIFNFCSKILLLPFCILQCTVQWKLVLWD